MRVLSLFDGISCARVALDRAGFTVEDYYAAEVDKSAIKVALKNYPKTQPIGDVKKLCGDCLLDIDLLIGGSPCQDLSIAKKGRKGLDGDRSGLFWEWVRLWKIVKPKWFVLENVASMPQKDRDIITRELGVEPVLFNAALVSAQSRKRLFWTNIPFKLPEDRGILLKDILQPENEVDERFIVKNRVMTTTPNKKPGEFIQVGYFGAENECKVGDAALRVYADDGKTPTLSSGTTLVRTTVKYTETAQTGRNETKKLGFVNDIDHQANRVYDEDGKIPAQASVCNSMVLSKHQQTNLREVDEKAHSLCATMFKGSHANGMTLVKVGHIGNSDAQANRVYDANGKASTLSANGGGLGAKTGLYKVGRDIGRRLNTDGHRADADESLVYQRCIETREDGKCGTLTSVQKDNLLIHIPTITTHVEMPTFLIRKLTPIECERLQGLPDNYTECVANTNRYKCLGNAFNVDVVAHILRGMHSPAV